MFTTTGNGSTRCSERSGEKQKLAGMLSRFLPIMILLVLVLPATAARAEFGFEPGSVRVTALNRDGSPDLRAGTHPYELVVQFNLNTESSGRTEGGQMRDVIIEFAAGVRW